METDIFDLSDLSDIPQEIKRDLKILARDDFEKNIIKLFKKAARQLTIDEVTVAYFRFFKEKKDRKAIMAKLYNMSRSKRPAIISVENRKGVYVLAEGCDEIEESAEDLLV